MLQTIFGWTAAAVAIAAFFAGPGQAAQLAGSAASTIGITAGALIGGADNLINGFNTARDASDGGTGGKGLLGNDRPNKPQKQQRSNAGAR